VSPLRAALLCALLVGCGEHRSAEPPRNLVIVVLDTVRADHLSCYGYGRPTSPNLERFAEQAFLFENAQSPAPWTAPALVSLMTSLHPDAHGVLDFPFPKRLNDGVTTLAEILQSRGYATAAFTEGGYAKPRFGLGQGFDLYPDAADDDNAFSTAFTRILENNVERALDWLGEHSREPFFLFFHTYEPHSPYRPPAADARRMRPDYDEAADHARLVAAIEAWNADQTVTEESGELMARHWFHCMRGEMPAVRHGPALQQWLTTRGLTWEQQSADPDWLSWLSAFYDGEIAYTDRQVQRLFDALEALELDGDTVVVVVSDHGEGLGDHGLLAHGKVLYEELLRVALIVRAPGVEFAPRRIPDLVSTVDVAPTLLDLMGIGARDARFQGRSLVPLMGGEARQRPAFSHALGVADEEQRVHTVRFGHWRLTHDEVTGRMLLFDLSSDPGELLDVSGSHPDRVAEGRALLERRRALDRELSSELSPKGDGLEIDEALLRGLQGLGYVEGELESGADRKQRD
jgi:arylsulfatase A-like enzyme